MSLHMKRKTMRHTVLPSPTLSSSGRDTKVKEAKASGSNEGQSNTYAVPVSDASCPICQEPIGTLSPEGVVEAWSSLPCGHRFGSHCIKHYLRIVADDRPSCPVCRRHVYHSCGHPCMPTIIRPSCGSGTATFVLEEDTPTRLAEARRLQCAYCRTPGAEEQRRRGGKRALFWGLLRKLRPNRPVEHATVSTMAGRPGFSSTTSWNGPWVDPFPRPRDPSWEKWWVAQEPKEKPDS